MHRDRSRRAQRERPHLTLAGGILTVLGIRMAVVFADPGLLQPGPGDALLLRLGPWFPGLPIMLLSRDASTPLAYASFDARPLLAQLDLSGMVVHDIDLGLLPPDGRDMPF